MPQSSGTGNERIRPSIEATSSTALTVKQRDATIDPRVRVEKQRFVRREVVGVRNRRLGRSSGYRITLLTAPSQAKSSVAIAVVVPGYSGGTATDSHRLPYSSVEHSSTDTHVVREWYRTQRHLQLQRSQIRRPSSDSHSELRSQLKWFERIGVGKTRKRKTRKGENENLA